jgi:hypothetical protein
MSKVLSRQTNEDFIYTTPYLPLALLDDTSTILDYSIEGAYILRRRTMNKLQLRFSYFPCLSHPFPTFSNVNGCCWQQRSPPMRQFYQDPAYVPGVLHVIRKGTCQGRARNNRIIPTSTPLCGRPTNGSSCNTCSCLSIFIVRFIQHDDESDRSIETHD